MPLALKEQVQHLPFSCAEAGVRFESLAESSASLLDDRSLELLAVGALHEHLVAMEADGDGGTRAEFAGSITIAGFGIVLADIFRAIYPDYDGRPAVRAVGKFTPDLLFRLGLVFQVATGKFSVADVDFFGAAADRLMQVPGSGRPGVGGIGSGVHEFISPTIAAAKSCVNSSA